MVRRPPHDGAAPGEGLRPGNAAALGPRSSRGCSARWRSHVVSSRQNRALGANGQRDGIFEPPGEQRGTVTVIRMSARCITDPDQADVEWLTEVLLEAGALRDGRVAAVA